MVALPESLPYDYVDSLIDSTLRFYTYTGTVHIGGEPAFQWPIQAGRLINERYVGNHIRLMFEVNEDYWWVVPDEDGYVFWDSEGYPMNNEEMLVMFGVEESTPVPYEFGPRKFEWTEEDN